MPEFYDLYWDKLMDTMKKGNYELKEIATYCLCKMIVFQYSAQRRQEQIQQIVDELGASTSCLLRKVFVFFVQWAAVDFSRHAFKENFWDLYL